MAIKSNIITGMLSVIVVARDEENVIEGCLKRLSFADEVIVVIDDRSEDNTENLAKKYTHQVFRKKFGSFAELKNFGINKAGGDWILIVDADERVGVKLANEITSELKSTEYEAFSIPFDTYFFGSLMRWGGWDESHIRLIRKERAVYKGEIHETFDTKNLKTKELSNSIAHFSHRSVIHNLLKTANYADVQAKMMLANGHPRVKVKSLFGVVIREFFRVMIKNRGYKDGIVGVIEGLYQPFSVFCVHVRLWELQQHPSIEEKYKLLEDKIDAV